MNLSELRRNYHREVCARLLGYRAGALSNADRSNERSKHLAEGLLGELGFDPCPAPPSGQTLGDVFTKLTCAFLRDSFGLLGHLRPGRWSFATTQDAAGIGAFDQYDHLPLLGEAIRQLDKRLAAALGRDYLVRPDIIVGREPEPDEAINARGIVLPNDTSLAQHSPLRSQNAEKMTLHASVSCKWTIRSDRAQNTRTEALNLIRNRKGKTPHIVAVVAEPLPTRIASLALGTGDIDCVYHMALPELRKVAAAGSHQDQAEMLETLVEGKRLRDIADLPFDLAL